MEYQELKNFGKLYTGNASPRVMMKAFTAIPGDLGFMGTPKFLARLQRENRYWKKRRFKTAEERGLRDKEFIEGIQYSLAVYTSLLKTCGEDKLWEFYPGLIRKLAVMMWEDFFPDTEDFLQFPDPWAALREYMLEFFRTWERGGVCRFEVLRETDEELHFRVVDCAWDAMHREYGHPDIVATTSDSELVVFPRLAQGVGGDMQNSGRICCGDSCCEWHLSRHRVLNSDRPALREVL